MKNLILSLVTFFLIVINAQAQVKMIPKTPLNPCTDTNRRVVFGNSISYKVDDSIKVKKVHFYNAKGQNYPIDPENFEVYYPHTSICLELIDSSHRKYYDTLRYTVRINPIIKLIYELVADSNGHRWSCWSDSSWVKLDTINTGIVSWKWDSAEFSNKNPLKKNLLPSNSSSSAFVTIKSYNGCEVRGAIKIYEKWGPNYIPFPMWTKPDSLKPIFSGGKTKEADSFVWFFNFEVIQAGYKRNCPVYKRGVYQVQAFYKGCGGEISPKNWFGSSPSSIKEQILEKNNGPYEVYNLKGQLIKKNQPDLKNLPKGVYIIKQKSKSKIISIL